MKVLSIVLHGEEKAWEANGDTVKMTKKGDKVTITHRHEKFGPLQTVVNLAQVPVYTIG